MADPRTADLAPAPAPVRFDAAELEAYARGRSREIALVRAARERGRAATTAAERAAASQAEWPEQTMAEAARAAGLPVARYRAVRTAVDHVLETLDLQGAIDGPLAMDTANASPAFRRRLTEDAFAALDAGSAAALRAALPRLAALWAEYMELVAQNG